LKIGYARVSTGLQNLNLQEDQLNQYGCEKIFSDHISGSKSKRPGLDKAIEFARAGDTIVVWRLDRLGRNMEDLITLVNELNNRGVSFHSLEENITMDKSSSTGQLLFHEKGEGWLKSGNCWIFGIIGIEELDEKHAEAWSEVVVCRLNCPGIWAKE
jgi:DNA invertase Pin-like site-specific DNA recombinase